MLLLSASRLLDIYTNQDWNRPFEYERVGYIGK